MEQDIDEPTPRTDGIIGVDTGYGVLATIVDGATGENEAFPNPAALAKHERKLATLQRELSRRQKGSANRAKTKAKIAKLHAKIANIREHHLHNVSRAIVDKGAEAVAVEGFNVRDMMSEATQDTSGRYAQRAKRLADAGIGELRRQLAYKQAWAGGRLITIDASPHPSHIKTGRPE